ncbi:MAG TPA: UDP-N-acetylmuramate dehydrogenase [Burkholderiales bacterium]|nr:UDP-N-acetylmuramate dehydrogenase [Burkholderiales bacterium]
MNMTDPRHFGDGGIGGELRTDEPMRRHVSWRAGGPVSCAYKPVDLDDLQLFVTRLRRHEPLHFVGLGSNLLVRDGGLAGTAIFTHGVLNDIELIDRHTIFAAAGVASPKVARFAALHDLAGAEFLAGIPGTVGGALAMNAGCFGGVTWEIVASVITIDRGGVVHERAPDQYEIGYRHVALMDEDGTTKADGDHPSSFIPHPSEEWFIGARFRLEPGDGVHSRQLIRQLLERRIRTQPLAQPNAGSVFRNPPGEFAARLIESCGLKGHAIGGAMISPKHANFIVNTGSAMAADIEALIVAAENAVQQKYGVALEREVRIVGEAST